MGRLYQPYSIAKTLWKTAKAAGILGAGALSTVAFPAEGDGLSQWLIFAATLTPPVIEGYRNYRKNK